MLSFPRICGNLEIPLNLLRYTNLQLLPYKRCLPLTTLSADDDEGVMKVPRELGACANSVYQALFLPPPYKSLGMKLATVLDT